MFYNTSSKIIKYITILFPIFFITGSFLPDLALSTIAILYISNLLFNNKNTFLNNRLFLFIILFWLYIILSSFWAYDFDKSLFSSTLYLRFLLIPFALNYFLIKEKNTFIILSIISFFIIIILGIDIIYQNYNGTDIFNFPSKMDNVRNSGFFKKLIGGSFICKMFFISIMFFNSAKIRENILLIFYFLFVIFVEYLTGERMAFLLLIFGVLIYIGLLRKKIITKILYIFLLSLLIFLIAIFNQKNTARMFDQTVNQVLYGSYNLEGQYTKTTIDKITGKERTKKVILDSGWGAHWLTAYEIFKAHKLFGSGFRSFRFLCDKKEYEINSDSERGRCTTHPHNFYIEILAELGLIGICFFLTIIFEIFIKIKKNFFKILKDNNSKISLIILILILWPFATTGSLFTNYNASYFWFLFSISIFNLNIIKNN
jgi:O-antigen ligase